MAGDKDIKSKTPEVTNDKTNTKEKSIKSKESTEKMFDISAALYAMEHGCKVDIGLDKGKCFNPFNRNNSCYSKGRCTVAVWAYCNEAFKAAINNTSDSETKAKIEDIRKKFMNQGGRFGAFVASHNLMEPYGFQKVFTINGPLDAAQRKELSSKCLPGDIAIMKCKEGRKDRYYGGEHWDGHAAMCFDPKTPIWCSDFKQGDWWVYNTWPVDWVVIYRFTNGSYSGNATYSTGTNNETCVPCQSNMYNLGEENANIKLSNGTEDAYKRASYVAKKLIESGEFNKVQACAIVGVFLDENACNPKLCCKAEKSGKGASYATQNFAYGAGIGSWTGTEYKNSCLRLIGEKPYTPIESLDIDKQIRIVIEDSKRGNNKEGYAQLRTCQTIEDASATAVCITGGFYEWYKMKKIQPHPTPADAKRVSNIYCESNNRRFGKSEHHCNLDLRRLAYAKEVFKRIS